MMVYETEIKHAFQNVYQTIAFDLGEFSENGTITREDLFDICLDFIYQYGELPNHVADYWRDLSLGNKMNYRSTVFPFELYEVQ